MKFWKSKSPGSNRYQKEGGDLISRLKRDIPRLRKQGEPPEKDTGSFSRFLCDLCNEPFAYSELRQCVLCGRWACPSCWTEEYYVCNSCNGMIRLHSLQENCKK